MKNYRVRFVCLIMAILLPIMTVAQSAQNTFNVPTPDMQVVRSLYLQGRFIELGDYLKAYLSKQPSDSKARAMFIVVLLKLQEKQLALNEFAILKQDTTATAYVGQITHLLSDIDRQVQAKAKLISALQNYNATEAANAIDELAQSPLQNVILKSFLDLYRGDFEQAKTQLQSIKSEKLSEQTIIRGILVQLDGAQKKYDETKKRVDLYLYSEVTSNACNSFLMNEKQNSNGKYPSIKAQDLQQYIHDVEELSTLAPLDPQVMDFTFHTFMLGRQYADVEQLGDRIIKAKGTLRIPFLSQNGYFWVVIDGAHKRISTQPDEIHRFQVYYDYPALIATDYTPLVMFHAGSAKKHSDQARWYEKEAPFDLSFDEVQTLSQKAKDWRGGLEAKAYALKFSSTAVAPNYLLMNVLACVYGEEAQRNATRNFGKFVAHALEPHKINAELVDPSKHTIDIWGDGNMLGVMAGAYGAMAQRTGNALATQNATMVSSIAESEQQKAVQRNEEQEAAREMWYQNMANTGFSLVDNQAFSGIEQLVGLMQ